MNILICSHWFEPSIGGVESVSKILAEEWARTGHEVVVVTNTAASHAEPPRSYTIVRQPARAELQRLARASNVVFQNTIALQTLIRLVKIRKPIVVAHQSWMRTTEGKRSWKNWLKMLAVRFVSNCSISQAIAADLPVSSTVIPNPFEVEEFEPFSGLPKTEDVVFVGRLVSDKGCDLLLEAVGQLQKRGVAPGVVSIIGDGPELPSLKALARSLGIEDRVRFLGAMREGRGQVMARHRIHVVPSRWKEPFGIVALEGIASGCAMIVSAGGGLPEAVGPCGLLFPNNDATELATQLERLLTEPGLRDELTARGPAHLQRFRPERVAADYLRIFEHAVDKQVGGA